MAEFSLLVSPRQIRLRPSAILYYERIGLLPPAERLSGQRRYDPTVLYRLAIIQRARQLGFTLSEIRCGPRYCQKQGGAHTAHCLCRRTEPAHSHTAG